MRLLPSSTLAAVIALAKITAAFPIVSRQSTCYSGAYVITLHGCGGSGSSQGPERAYTDGIVNGIPGSAKYPMPFDGNCGLDYYASLNSGVSKLKETITTYSNRCPNHRIAIVGYSEGAHVAMNTLGGWHDDGNTTTPINTSYTINLEVVVLMGDPSRTANQTYNRGSSTTDGGGFPRHPNSIAKLAPYVSRVVSFCDKGDEYCALYTTGTGDNVHGSYFSSNHYVNDGLSFAIGKLKA